MSLRCTHGEDKALECRGRVVGEGGRGSFVERGVGDVREV